MEHRRLPSGASQASYEQDSPTVPGPYQYYTPPAATSSGDKRRSFSERTAGSQPLEGRGAVRPDSKKALDLGITGHLTQPFDDAHLHGLDSPAIDQATTHTCGKDSIAQPPLRIDPYAVSSNSRNQPWSPELTSPRTRPRQKQLTNASEPMRHNSISDRSPLQQLEAQLSNKEQKRARVEQAEERARQRSLGKNSLSPDLEAPRLGARAVSDGDRRLVDPSRRTEEKARHASSGTTADGANRGERRIHKAPEYSPDVTMRSPSDKYAAGRPGQDARIAVESRPYGDSPVLPKGAPRPQHARALSNSQRGEVERFTTGKTYPRNAVAIGAGMSANTALTAAERGRIAHERRKSQLIESSFKPPVTPTSPRDATQNDRGSQQRQILLGSPYGTPTFDDAYVLRQPLRSHPVSGGGIIDNTGVHAQDQAPAPRPGVANASKDSPNYRIPPQTASGQQARQQVGFGAATTGLLVESQEKHHRFGDMFHRHGQAPRYYERAEKSLEEWRNAETARLTAQDLEFDSLASGAANVDKNDPWWAKNKRRSISGGSNQLPTPQTYDGPYEELAKQFKPALYTKCGPLLRYTGMRQETTQQPTSGTKTSAAREIWRGSIMIVTDDALSDYSTVPTLRIFAQPMDLLPPTPQHLRDSGMELPPEYEDPVAGQVKLSRTGRPLYVRPVHDIDGEIDLSREENPQGLYAATRTPVLGPQSTKGADGRPTQHITFQDKSRIKGKDGEKARRFTEIKGCRLHVERDFTFWRFNIEIELASTQQRISYRINNGPAIGFWVPARHETMNIMFHSCNGFSMSVDPNTFSGPDPLWRDVLNSHQSRPFHVMLGGGDQIYNDAAMRDTTLFREWLQIKNPEHKHKADFTTEMQAELELFYLNRYCMWFSQGLFAMANSQIPMVNIFDDHDIIDGYGSYPHHFMSSPVFTGLGNIAFKYYMLFQHQSTLAETQREEPSWILGASRGPYINEFSRSVFMRLGRKVALLGVDCRTERMRDEILSEESYDLIFKRCESEIVKGETKHLIVLLGVPIAYPRLNFLENILTSRVMDPIKALGRTGMLGGFVNKFDGGVEILDDLDDHWTAKHHKAERNWFIQELQQLAADYSVRITILGGDVHLGAIGQFYTPKHLGVVKHKDHRYMPNVVSSAIVNTPPPTMMADILNKRNKVHHFDHETDEDLIPMFDKDVDGSRRNNNHLLPRRNYCTIREYVPGSTPPPSPKLGPSLPATHPDEDDLDDDQRMGRDRRFPPGSMKRTMSLTRGPMNLVRRISGAKPRRTASFAESRPPTAQQQSIEPPAPTPMQRSNSLGGPRSSLQFNPDSDEPNQRPTFLRRPTSLSVKEARKAAAKGGPDADMEGDEASHVNLEHGLDISLNMEINQKDPGGSTAPYRLLVPALWYEGERDMNTLELKGRKIGLLQRLRSRRRGHQVGDDGRSRSPSPDSSPEVGRDQYASRFAGPGSNIAGMSVPNQPAQPRYDEKIVPESPSERSSAHRRGFGGLPPPIGQHTDKSEIHEPQMKKNPYAFSGFQRATDSDSPTLKQNQPPQQRQRGYDGTRSEDSLAPSEDSFEQGPRRTSQSQGGRRLSKAEKLLGIGDGDTPFPEQAGLDDGHGKRKKWQIWKSRGNSEV
ncbi:Hypothetical protein R9X50_00525700 [Acrodontium crateriforme]|uniref:PhoD-like phosphatase domain-containing protein n=1 Tax=Acrodontium crateriforme TaxID=150365 RepID=A0AAQ3M6T5_9PEZI|nr:Hypothetical protein R9X50_00525700 [Acrodontium crateriforme]